MSGQIPQAKYSVDLVDKLATQLNNSTISEKLDFLNFLVENETRYDTLIMYHRFLRDFSAEIPEQKVAYPWHG